MAWIRAARSFVFPRKLILPFIEPAHRKINTDAHVCLEGASRGILEHSDYGPIDAANGWRGFRPRRGEFEQRHSVVEIIRNSFDEP